MSLFHDSALVGSSGQSTGYQISRSLRFNSSDSSYCGRTFSSVGNRQTWTLSWWMKRSKIGGVNEFIFGTGGSNTVAQMFFDSSEKFRYGTFTGEPLVTAAVFRDVSAWYHFVFVHNTANATAADRLILYVNGVRADTSTYTAPTQNSDGAWNRAVGHVIGGTADGGSGAAQPSFNGYLADIHFIDGQALTPSDFAETDATTGQWVPKAYTGTYGTNGFQLKFADNSNNTAATLGKDTSGNGNNWTPNNLSVTAGAGNDSLVDTPTSYGTDTGAGGEVRGNYATLNPLQNPNGVTLSNGNLNMVTPNNSITGLYGTIGVSSGKWYWEFTQTASTVDGAPRVGIANGIGGTFWTYNWDATKQTTGSRVSYGATFTNNDVIGVALDIDSGTLAFYKNGASQGTAFTGLAAGTYFPLFWEGGTTDTYTANVNFGQRPFAYTAPSGFKALCDTNLPAPVVAKPNQYFGVGLYTGNNGSNTITTGIDNTTNAGLLWIKNRTIAANHNIYDKVRGYSSLLELPTTAAEYSYSVSLAETSTGYTLNTGSAQFNASGSSYVAWNWAAGSSTVTNTQGSITSQVRANASAGFSIVTYTGTGSAATVGHGLGVAPRFIILKSRSNALFWYVYAAALNNPSQYLLLNVTDPAGSASVVWNSTAPTSTTFSIGTDTGPNTSGATYVAYCFAPVAGYSAFGSYTGNGSSTDGPFIFTGFRPSFVLIKRTDGTSTDYVWWITDSKRGSYNPAANLLQANSADAENSGSLIDLLSNGFKLRNGSGSVNGSGGTFIYAAFAESPFAYSRAR